LLYCNDPPGLAGDHHQGFPSVLIIWRPNGRILFNPNQLWANGLVVNTCPKQYLNGKSLHGIYHKEDDLYIPFCMHGCTSYFSSQLLAQQEINNYQQIVFTSEQEWDLYSQTFASLKKNYENKEQGATKGEIFTNAGADTCVNIGATSSHNRHSTVDVTALAWHWGTSIKTASNTLTSTTTHAV